MREIKFRGKRKDDGEWVYGGIVHQTDYYGDPVDKYFIIDGTETLDYDIGESHEVFPETVGQYTGLKDKNGVGIYEGDIVFFEPFNTHINDRIVKWEDGMFVGELIRSGWSKPLRDLDAVNITIIGNIHDEVAE